MKLSSKKLRVALAGEYALGNLSPRARRRFERLLRANPGLQCEVEAWHRRMNILTIPAPIQPPGIVWARIGHDLDRADDRVRLIATRQPRRQTSVRLWQAWAGLASAAALYMAVLLVREAPAEALRSAQVSEAAFEAGFARAQPVKTSSATTARGYRGYMGMVSLPEETARWRVGVDLDTRMLRVESTGTAVLNTKEDYQLWWVSDEEIISVGLLPRSGGWEVVLPRHLRLTDFSRLAITREPAYGSPAGDGPTGPVLMNTALSPSS